MTTAATRVCEEDGEGVMLPCFKRAHTPAPVIF